MFDIGFFELLVIGVISLVVVGPERLPDAVRSVTLWIGRLRQAMQQTKQELENEFGTQEIKQQLRNEAIMRELAETKQQLNNLVVDPLNDHNLSAAAQSRSEQADHEYEPLPSSTPQTSEHDKPRT